MLTPTDIERHVNTLRFAGLTRDQHVALDALVEALTTPLPDRFYILEREAYEGETLFTTPYPSIQAAAEGHFTPDRSKATDVYVLRARNNILELVAEVFDRENWHMLDGIAP